MNNDLEIYYKKALHFTKSHYENFPVLSFFIRKDLQKHVAAVYQFARQADDIADEGNYSEEKRIEALENYKLQLKNCLENNNPYGFWKVLNNTITQKQLRQKNFYDLLKAFKLDISKNRYESFDELLQYCENSA
ncbi:MAG: squalene/phytoene synthase family protein, partial [Melioribacteraceae bacterium]|nr:squalene/phytoene synthase family protein [Melioribacteraceae bacterium]